MRDRGFVGEMESIKIVSDETRETDFAKDVIKAKKDQEAFQILDVGDVIAKHMRWLQKVPRVLPHFGRD